MQRDAKIGIAIGVLLIALIAIFWFMRSNNAEQTLPPAEPVEGSGAVLPQPIEPVAPVGTEALPPEPAGPVVSVPVPPPTGAATPPMTTGTGATAVPSPVEAVQPPVVSQQTHTVASGDTLSSISRKYYGTEAKWQQILDANKDKISSPSALKIGTVLTIPNVSTTTTATTAAPSIERKHTVASGETLSSISKKYYGTDGKWRLIYNANKSRVPDPDRLQVGVELVIPAEQ